MLVDLFTQILDMSLMGSIVIAVVLLCRLLLRRVPRIYSYVLWFAVLFRLLCPVSLTAPVSVLPEGFDSAALIRDMGSSAAEATVRYENGSQEFADAIASGAVELIRYDGESTYILLSADDLGTPDTVEDIWYPILGVLWGIGVLGVLAYSLISYIRLHRRLIGAVPHADGYFLADHIESPFVMGVIVPKIYLPSDLPEDQRTYILAHERHHIRRMDHIVKLAAFMALCIHWFNPLAWLMFHLLVKDMEMSCDEAVLKKLGRDIRSDYSALLLNLSVGSQHVAWTPLAFGEGDISGRIRNILSWRKPAAWVTVLALVLTCVVSVSAVTDPELADAIPVIEELRDIRLYTSYICSGNETDQAEALTQRQQARLEQALRELPESAVKISAAPASNHIFSVGAVGSYGAYVFHYGYVGGDSVLTLEKTGEQPRFWQLQDETLCELLYHYFICEASVPMDHDDIPESMVPYETHHGRGHYTDLYHYHCTVCDQDGVIVSSYACTCKDCSDVWNKISSDIRQNGKFIP